jgi:hypothetical protein
MKQRIHSSDERDTDSDGALVPVESVPSQIQLNLVQRQILERLGPSAEAVTLRQLQTAVTCGPVELHEALEALIKAGLISRLNTVIPSYVHRYPGIRVYGE